MASASETFCGVCETQHVVRDADFWCSECDEGLCSSCEKHHRASKASRNHEVISMNNYQKLPHTIASINQYCSDHDKKYQYFCSQHENLCCPLCITTNHKTCDLMAIDDIVKTSKTSALYDIMEQSLQDVKKNLGRIVKDRRQNLGKIQQQRQTFHTDIQMIRDKINKHLDILENEILQDIKAVEQKVHSQIERLLSKFSDHEKSLDELQKNIVATKTFATDLQSFLGGKMFEAQIHKEEMFMQSLLKDGNLQQINLKCRMDDKMLDILSMTKIGEISVITTQPTITLKMDRDKQAQHTLPTISKTINDINLTLLKKIEIPEKRRGNGIRGCTIMPTWKIVFVDNFNSRLLIHKENGLFDYEIPVSQRPVDVTCINENTVAVTHNAKPDHIEIINIADRKSVKRIETFNACFGITNIEGRLIYYELGSGILTADVTDDCREDRGTGNVSEVTLYLRATSHGDVSLYS
ncbi:protein wech-like [Mytilus trossulus]|uniref:protein wech-like n=1 Tax=Mytilus trossulus TaxID=6551 RepID=UPI0030049FA8